MLTIAEIVAHATSQAFYACTPYTDCNCAERKPGPMTLLPIPELAVYIGDANVALVTDDFGVLVSSGWDRLALWHIASRDVI